MGIFSNRDNKKGYCVFCGKELSDGKCTACGREAKEVVSLSSLLAAGLGGDADVGFFDLPCFVFGQKLNAKLGRFTSFVQPQDHGGVLVQAADAKI